MLTGIHILLTYTCSRECDHCFVYGSPQAEGTFTLKQLNKAFGEIKKIGSIEWVYFEGGEPFLFYPLMIEGIRMARDAGFEVGAVTNAYWATSEGDAELWLRQLFKLGVSDLSISDDSFHSENDEDNTAKRALAAAKSIGMAVQQSSILCSWGHKYLECAMAPQISCPLTHSVGLTKASSFAKNKSTIKYRVRVVVGALSKA